VKLERSLKSPQRGASLLETSIAVGLVGIAVFATVSSFGSNISLKISHGILPTLGGSPAGFGDPADKSGELGSGTGNDDNPVGGIAGDGGAPEDDGWEGRDDNSLVGGTGANPPDDIGEDQWGGSSVGSLGEDNSFTGGIDMLEPPEDLSFGYGDSSEPSALFMEREGD
jgi:hypothetical protein